MVKIRTLFTTIANIICAKTFTIRIEAHFVNIFLINIFKIFDVRHLQNNRIAYIEDGSFTHINRYPGHTMIDL